MSFNLGAITGLAHALHGVGSPQEAQRDPGFLSRYLQVAGNPLTSPTPVRDQGGLMGAVGEALHGNPQPGSLAGGIASIMSNVPSGAPQGFSGSSTAPVPTTGFTGGAPQGQPAESPLTVRGIRPRPEPATPPQQAPVASMAPQGQPQGPPAPMQGAPVPPERPADQALFQPRTDAPDPHGPIASTPTMWGANYHGPENSLFNRLGASSTPDGTKGPGEGLNAFAQSGAMDSFKGQAGPNLLNFFNMFS